MNKKIVRLVLTICFLYGILFSHVGWVESYTFNYTKEEICSAIYIIEGGENTNYPYGIKSVSCNGKDDCKQVCFNTVVNNKRRYKEYGYKQFNTFLEFLGSRYCPEGDLCNNWLPNLKYYLNKGNNYDN